MGAINQPDGDVTMVESACGIGLMLAGFAVAAHVMFSVAELAADAAQSPFLALL